MHNWETENMEKQKVAILETVNGSDLNSLQFINRMLFAIIVCTYSTI